MRLLFVLLPACACMAQPPSLPNLPASTDQTFGMVGVAVNQTARLNVLNSTTPVVPPPNVAFAPPPCKVTLDIYDDQSTKLQELVIDNLAPGKAQHIDYVRSVSATPQRVQVRGAVTLTSTAGSGTVIPPVRVYPSVACSVVSTLEIFDNDTGKTLVVLTSPAAISGFILASSVTPTAP